MLKSGHFFGPEFFSDAHIDALSRTPPSSEVSLVFRSLTDEQVNASAGTDRLYAEQASPP
jgi:hypothetical protein